MGAVGFLCWVNTVRAQRVTYVSHLDESAAPEVDATSPTGFAGGIRQLIVPEHNNDSYQWIAQTQQMLTRGEWRLRHVNYDNAPNGREIRTPSPYRWWLGLVAWIEHKRSEQPLASSVERAALTADPALQILLLFVTVIFIARRFGALAASSLGLCFATLFPFSSAFLPGQPSDYGLSLVGALWSVLPLLVGVHAMTTKGASASTTSVTKHRASVQRWFFLAGVAGGLSLWIGVTRQLPFLTGIALGGIGATWLMRRETVIEPLPWRAWALGGAAATLAAFLVEYFPSHLELKAWRIETVHPLYAVAWLGTGELLVRFGEWIRPGKFVWKGRVVTAVAMALLSVAALPALIFLKDDRAWLTADALASRLTNLPNGTLAVAFVPLLLLAPVVWLLVRRGTAPVHRIALAITAGPVLVALGFACFQIRWWNLVDSALLAVVVAVSAAVGMGLGRWLWAGLVTLALLPGLIQLLPRGAGATADSVTETEVVALVERDLAHWLANRAGPDRAVVLAPPNLTTSLYFHGGLRGIGTPYAENKEGFAAAVRLAAAATADEAQALIRKRNVTHVVMPSWDPFLDEYARLGSTQSKQTLIGLLHQWLPPRWLRPVPYRLPQVAGFEGQSVLVFEVVDVQDNATALSGLAEYFAEMGQFDPAVAVSHALERSFPTDLGALVAQAQVAMAVKDAAVFNRILNHLVPRLTEDEAQGLAWDRRVSLAIVLAEGKRHDSAREQLQRCLAEMDEPLLRSLTPTALYRLQALAKAFGLEITEPALRDLAHRLLPPEMRAAL
jgi:tetratricopeptide (TPR) repeat protein